MYNNIQCLADDGLALLQYSFIRAASPNLDVPLFFRIKIDMIELWLVTCLSVAAIKIDVI